MTDTDTASRPEPAHKRWLRRADDNGLLKHYATLIAKKEDLATVRERMRRIHAMTGGAEDVKPVAKPKRARKPRALSPKALAGRLDVVSKAGLKASAILPDGTIEIGTVEPQRMPEHKPKVVL
jgi:hypothetical protein